ncbi:hypothetical protein EON66_01935 [archaeon]|nr:MAG: hypothetical protein EON66_01935 [archaeon]
MGDAHMRELITINKSLSALGNVIDALTDSKLTSAGGSASGGAGAGAAPSTRIVPFRDSILTVRGRRRASPITAHHMHTTRLHAVHLAGRVT